MSGRIYQPENRLQAAREWVNSSIGFSVCLGLCDLVLLANLVRMVVSR